MRATCLDRDSFESLVMSVDCTCGHVKNIEIVACGRCASAGVWVTGVFGIYVGAAQVPGFAWVRGVWASAGREACLLAGQSLLAKRQGDCLDHDKELRFLNNLCYV